MNYVSRHKKKLIFQWFHINLTNPLFILKPNFSLVLWFCIEYNLFSTRFTSINVNLQENKWMNEFIYLFIRQTSNSPTAESARINTKGREKEEREMQGTEDKTSYPNPGNWGAHRGWRTKRKTEERKGKKQGVGTKTWYPGLFGQFLGTTIWTTRLAYSETQQGYIY